MVREGLTDDLRKLKVGVIKLIISEAKKEIELRKLAEKYQVPTWEIALELDSIRI